MAVFTCPLSPEFVVTRSCQFGGVWQQFDEDGCGVVNGELSRLENTFNNVSEPVIPLHIIYWGVRKLTILANILAGFDPIAWLTPRSHDNAKYLKKSWIVYFI